MANILGLTTMLAAATALVWSGARACRIKNRFVKWGVVGLAAVLAVAVSFAAALTIVGTVKQHAAARRFRTSRSRQPPNESRAARPLSMAFAAPAIREPARSPVASTSASTSHSASGRSFLPT